MGGAQGTGTPDSRALGRRVVGMRALGSLCVILLLPGASAAFLHKDRDASDDVTRTDGTVREPASWGGVDIVSIDAQRWEGELLVGVRFAEAIPQDLDLTVVYQVGPEPDMVGMMSFSRMDLPGSRPDVVSFFTNRTGREPEPVKSGAIVGRDAIQFVFEEKLLDGFPCFALRSAEVSHLDEDGWLYEDAYAREPTCVIAASSDAAEARAAEVDPPAPSPEPAGRATVPIPLLAALGGIAVAAAVARRKE